VEVPFTTAEMLEVSIPSVSKSVKTAESAQPDHSRSVCEIRDITGLFKSRVYVKQVSVMFGVELSHLSAIIAHTIILTASALTDLRFISNFTPSHVADTGEPLRLNILAPGLTPETASFANISIVSSSVRIVSLIAGKMAETTGALRSIVSD